MTLCSTQGIKTPKKNNERMPAGHGNQILTRTFAGKTEFTSFYVSFKEEVSFYRLSISVVDSQTRKVSSETWT